MPELPEVETIVRDLRAQIVAKKINSVDVFNPGTVNDLKFADKVQGRKVISINRYGKNIVIELSDIFIVIHLKMTGQLVWRDAKQTLAGGHPITKVGLELPNKFTRVGFKIGAGKLYFNDVRKFGWVHLMNSDELCKYLNKLGVEPLTKQFTASHLNAIIKNRTTAIKKVLLDQSLIVGLGNIYVDEALWLAGILPERSAKSLTSAELKALHQAIKKVLKLSIKNRGTSFSDYRDGLGAKGGNFKFLKVYNRNGAPCLKCGTVINKKKLGGRGTHWCVICQH